MITELGILQVLFIPHRVGIISSAFYREDDSGIEKWNMLQEVHSS